MHTPHDITNTHTPLPGRTPHDITNTHTPLPGRTPHYILNTRTPLPGRTPHYITNTNTHAHLMTLQSTHTHLCQVAQLHDIALCLKPSVCGLLHDVPAVCVFWPRVRMCGSAGFHVLCKHGLQVHGMCACDCVCG